MVAPARKGKGEIRRKGAKVKAAPASEVARTDARKKGGRGVKPSRQDLGRQVSQELRKLWPVFKEVGSALLGRLDGELAGLAHMLNGGGISGETPVLPQGPVLIAMLDEIKALKVKPKKGRLKDLRRVETLLESLAGRVPSEA